MYRGNSTLLAVVCVTAACAGSSSGGTYEGYIANLTPPRWRQPGVWRFDVTDDKASSLGHVVLYLTGQSVEPSECLDHRWKKIVVLKDDLNVEFGLDSAPAYKVHGRWITVDLTASVCGADHLLNGELGTEDASGFFNYSHQLGGHTIGTFEATLMDVAE